MGDTYIDMIQKVRQDGADNWWIEIETVFDAGPMLRISYKEESNVSEVLEVPMEMIPTLIKALQVQYDLDKDLLNG